MNDDYTRDFSHVDRIMNNAGEEGVFTAASVVAGRGDKVLFRHAYGRLDIE